MKLSFSIIIPVYNRPEELKELLESLSKQNYSKPFEVIVVEDGSEINAEAVCSEFKNRLNLIYLSKENTGPGKSRNFGVEKASGNYVVFFDSDCIVPPSYLEKVECQLLEKYSDAYGGKDQAHQSFSPLQKAINYSMTSVLTTGGIRGGKKAVQKFQPRSFNMGVSKKAFEQLNGFSSMRIGEDIDFSLRLWQTGFKTQLIEGAAVFHKRRASLSAFYKQIYAFGKGRAQLNKIHPNTKKITYWFPSLFVLGFVMALLLAAFGFFELLIVFGGYFLLILIDATLKNKSIKVGVLSLVTTACQFFGYGLGFLRESFG